ncbi:hypothetical protein DFJ77DRAFT_436847 [Powellomyces hirtus]|nr:hypothetical protein DFJ77DRAFT_436847 [Powellomyces hirtus]
MDHRAVRALKQALRKSMRGTLAQLPVDQVRQETSSVVQKLLAMEEYKKSRSVSVYLSMPSGEISTTEIIEDIFRASMPALNHFRQALDEDGLDLIIVPGLAFDKEGWRLGHGKGYYDRYFAKVAERSALSGKALPTTIALALSAQIVDEPLPREDFDQKPQFLVTATGVVREV